MEFARLTPGPGFAPVQSLLYYGQRLITMPRARRFVVATLRAGIHARQGAAGFDHSLSAQEAVTLRAVRGCGYAPLPRLLSPSQVADVHAFFRTKLLVDRSDRTRQFTVADVPVGVRIADYGLPDILDSPHILELANSPPLLRLAASYIGCKPTISALGLRWSFPGSASADDVQTFHRDTDDWRYLKILVYLTDVDAKCGPHEYVGGSHLTKAPARLKPYSDAYVKDAYGADRLIVATGPAGFGFAVDTAGIHKGAVPARHARLMLQIQYSLLPAYAYRYAPLPYKGAVQFDSYINRLFCKREARADG